MSSAMDDDLTQARAQLAPDAYLKLDDSIRGALTRKEWLWLPDAKKATLEQDLCEPDPEN